MNLIETKEKAKKGDGYALLDLANYYRRFSDEFIAIDVDDLYKQAFDFFQNKAREGDANAMYELSYMYGEGKGIEENQTLAEEWQEKAILAGSIDARHWKYVTAINQGDVRQENLQKIEELANQGHVRSLYSLARIYHKGKIDAEDETKARMYETKLYDLLYAETQAGSADACRKIYQFAASSDEESFAWMEKAAELGDVDAQCDIADAYEEDEDYSKYFYWIKKAAEQGELYSMGYVANCYCEGIGVDRSIDEAYKWHLKAAQEGFIPSFHWAGWGYLNGHLGEVSYEKAVHWFELGYQKGRDLHCTFFLGECYYEGIGVVKSLDKAYELYKEVARRGDNSAPYKLWLMYKDGYQGDISEKELVEWLERATNDKFKGYLYFEASCEELGLYYAKTNFDEKVSDIAHLFYNAIENGEKMEALGELLNNTRLRVMLSAEELKVVDRFSILYDSQEWDSSKEDEDDFVVCDDDEYADELDDSTRKMFDDLLKKHVSGEDS